MRIAFAGFHIESVSFLTQEATYEMFDASASREDQICTNYSGTNTVPGGVIAACATAQIELVPLVYAYQGAVGPVSDEAVERYTAEICGALNAMSHTLDGVILHLHGAAVSPTHRDVERYIIECVRQAVGNKPIVVAFDYHGNLSQESVGLLNAAVAYKTSPHIDMAETGERAVYWIKQIIREPGSIAMAISKPCVVVPSIFSATNLEPLSSIMAHAAQIENDQLGTLDISVMAGFSYADTKDTGFSVIVVGDVGIAKVEEIASQLSSRIWSQREALVSAAPVYSLLDAIDYVSIKSKYARAPIVILEHADRMNDSTHVLKALLDKGIKNVAVPFIWDEDAVAEAQNIGAGNETTLKIGAWSSTRAGERLTVKCRVIETGPKKYKISGPMLTGQEVDLGQTALVDINGISVSLVSKFAFAVDEDAFTIFGQNPRDFQIILLRSKTHFRAFFEKFSEEIVIVDTPDWGTADLKNLPYLFLNKREMFPFNSSVDDG